MEPDQIIQRLRRLGTEPVPCEAADRHVGLLSTAATRPPAGRLGAETVSSES